MAFPLVGRKIAIYDMTTSPGVLVAGVTSKTATINAENIDITGDDDAGFRKLLSQPGLQSVDLKVEGVMKNTNLLTKIVAGTALLNNYELRMDTVGVLAGSFFLSSVELGAPHAEAVTFSASLASSGAFTFTPV